MIKISNQSGFSIIENLVAIGLISIGIAGSVPLLINCFNGNAAARTYSGAEADMQAVIDRYRNITYLSLLDKFHTSYKSILNGQTATENFSSESSRADYTITFTAIKSPSTTVPEAVKLNVSALHRKGVFDVSSYELETIISQAR